MDGSSRSSRPVALVLWTILAALTLATPAAAQSAPGLPRTYAPQIIDSPAPEAGRAFGWGITSGELTGDGRLDLLVAQSQGGPGRVFVFDGATGAHIDTIDPPERNPAGGGDEALGFVYVETMPDLGSCPGGDGPDADKICDLPAIGGGDGIPEILLGARGLRVNNADNTLPSETRSTNNATDPAVGRTYVFDGATRAVLKRIDMPDAERPGQNGAQFGRQTISPQAMPPCAGARAENNDAGVGPCPDVPRSVRIGDLNGGGQPDILVTARSYQTTGAQAPAGSQCNTLNATCTAGKAWAYSGEAIVGSDPRVILDTALYGVNNPFPQTGASPEFGGNLYRVGDSVGNDGAPEFIVPARNLDYPLRNPDDAFQNVGAAFMFNGRTGALVRTFQSPEPQPRSQFSLSFNGGRPLGDLGATTSFDALLPSPLQNVASTDDGVVYAVNGDLNAGGGAEASWQFARLPDPFPRVGGNFGGGFSGVGNLTDDGAPANEVLVGGFQFDPFTEASKENVNQLQIVNMQNQRVVQTIEHPTGARGDGFGVGITPMGDLNGDGFLDIAASAYLTDVGPNGGVGRAFILRSDNSPLPVAAATPAAPAPAAPASAPAALLPGVCANRARGREGADDLRGTLAGDRIFALGGNDVVRGFQGADCLDGGGGDDRLDGGADNDQVLGRAGNDRLLGGDDRDQLFGAAGGDVLDGGEDRDLLAGGQHGDRLLGGRGEDRLFGESGKDRLVGGRGRDFLDGGTGNDSIDVADGERDRVLCGKGRDRVRADRIDTLNGCERVTRRASR